MFGCLCQRETIPGWIATQAMSSPSQIGFQDILAMIATVNVQSSPSLPEPYITSDAIRLEGREAYIAAVTFLNTEL